MVGLQCTRRFVNIREPGAILRTIRRSENKIAETRSPRLVFHPGIIEASGQRMARYL